MRRRRVVLLALCVGLGLLFASTSAAGRLGRAHAASQPPPTLVATSLSQNGQDLLWRVQLSRSFSAGSLQRDGTSLCLLIEGASNGSVEGQVCVTPGRNGRPPDRLTFAAGGGTARVIDATVTRPGASSLSASFLPASAELGYRPMRWQTQLQSSASTCSGQCLALLPTAPQLLNLRAVKLVGCKATGPNWVFHGPTKVRDIALAFDDGPWGDPPSIDFVNELARLGVPATFFEIGDQIGTYDRSGAVERAMLAHGDMIGNHTWTHPDMPTLSAGAQRSELAQTTAAIKRATGFQVCLFRAPYGATSPALLSLVRSMGMTTIQWNIDPRDWSLPGVGEIESNVIDNATNGGIAEMHFGGGPRQETLDALPTIVSTLRKRGFKFVTITQMLGYQLIYK